ncbi:MAG: hypothetical protein AAF415_02910 [Pseudomonadota bacterium]
MQNIVTPPRPRALRSLPGSGMAIVLAVHGGIIGATAAGFDLDAAPLWMVRLLMGALAAELVRRMISAHRAKTRLETLPLAFWALFLGVSAWMVETGAVAWILFGLQSALVLGIALATIRRDGMGPLGLGWETPSAWRPGLHAPKPHFTLPVPIRPLQPAV